MENRINTYLKNLRQLLRESYWILKHEKTFPDEKKLFIDGYMLAGRILGIKYDELTQAVENANYDVFEMSVDERRKAHKEKPEINPEDYEIPTYIRKHKKLETH